METKRERVRKISDIIQRRDKDNDRGKKIQR
jgi:hypothetical protein